MVNFEVATFDGCQMKSPPTRPSSAQVPGARNLTQRPEIEQTVGVVEVIVGSIVNPSVGVFELAVK